MTIELSHDQLVCLSAILRQCRHNVPHNRPTPIINGLLDVIESAIDAEACPQPINRKTIEVKLP